MLLPGSVVYYKRLSLRTARWEAREGKVCGKVRRSVPSPGLQLSLHLHVVTNSETLQTILLGFHEGFMTSTGYQIIGRW